MCYVRKAVDMANAIDEFVDELNKYRVTVEDIKDIGFFKPEILKTVETISEWLDSSVEEVEIIKEVDVEEPIIEEEPEEDTPIAEEEVAVIEEPESEPESDPEPESEPEPEVEVVDDTKRKYNKLSEGNYRFIATFIADNYDGVSVKDARKDICEKLPHLPFRSIYRFIDKTTYKKLSDEYFVLEGKDKIIRVKEDRPVEEAAVYINELISNIKYPDKFNKVIDESQLTEAEWKSVMHNLARAKCDMGAIVNRFPNIDATALVGYETVKKAMIFGGLFPMDITDIDMTIIISSIVQKVGKRKIGKIANAIRKQWNVGNLRSEQIYGVINKTMYPEISSKFGI